MCFPLRVNSDLRKATKQGTDSAYTSFRGSVHDWFKPAPFLWDDTLNNSHICLTGMPISAKECSKFMWHPQICMSIATSLVFRHLQLPTLM